MTNIRTEAPTAIANANAEMHSLTSNSVELAKLKARDLVAGNYAPEREAPRSFQSTEVLAAMLGKQSSAIVKNQIVHDNKENKGQVSAYAQGTKNSGALQTGGAAHIYPGGAPSLNKRSQKDLLKGSQQNSHGVQACGHVLTSQTQGLKSNHLNNNSQSQTRGTHGGNKRTFGDDLTNRINHSYAMNHAAAMGHHILEPILNGNGNAVSQTSVSADNKVQQTKGQTGQSNQSVIHGHSGMNKSFDFVNTKQIANFKGKTTKVKQTSHRNATKEGSISHNSSLLMPKSSSAGLGNPATTHAKYMVNQHYLKAISQAEQQRVEVPKILSNSNQIAGYNQKGVAASAVTNSVGQRIATLDQLRPLLDGKQTSQSQVQSQTSANGVQTQVSSGAGAQTTYHSHTVQPPGSSMSSTQRLGALQPNGGRTASVGSVGQKMVQVHSQDSRVGHAHGLGSVLSTAQGLKIQKRKVAESKLVPNMGGFQTNLNHSNQVPKMSNRTGFNQLEQPLRNRKEIQTQNNNIPSQRNAKQQQQRQLMQIKEHAIGSQNNSFVKHSDKRQSTDNMTVRKSLTNSVNSTAKRGDASKYLDNSAQQSKQSTSYIANLGLETRNTPSITPDKIKLRRFYDKMKKGGIFETSVELVDQRKYFDPQYVAEHATHIYEHCISTESSNLPNPKYMAHQTDINASMREILIDWLVEVHLKFKLLPETLYLTVNIIDRYLDKQIVLRNKLQLVGVTAMLIASKYEEIYPPIVTDFVYITDNAYSKSEILEMEESILTSLEFGIHFTSQLRFLERYFYLKDTSENEKFLAQFLVEGCLIQYNMLKYNSSILAASALYLSSKLCYAQEPWSKQLAHVTHFQEATLRQCAKDIYQQVLLRNIDENSKLKAVFNKFSSSKYGAVSTKIQQQQNTQRDQNSESNINNSRQAIAKFSSVDTGVTEGELSSETTSSKKRTHSQGVATDYSSKFKNSNHSMLKPVNAEVPKFNESLQCQQRSFDKPSTSEAVTTGYSNSRISTQQAQMVTQLHQLQMKQIEQLVQMQSNNNPPKPQLSVRNHSSSKHIHQQLPTNFQQQRNSQGNLPRYQ